MSSERTWIVECQTEYGWVPLAGTSTGNKRYAYKKRREFAAYHKVSPKNFRVAEYMRIEDEGPEILDYGGDI